MGTRSSDSTLLGWLASWFEHHWKWFVVAAGILMLFVISLPMFVTDVLILQIQVERNTSFIKTEWVRPLQTTVSYLGAPIAAVICHWLNPTFVVLVGTVTSSILLVVSSFIHNEIIFFITATFFSPLPVCLCLHSVVYVLSTFFPKRKLTKGLAIATIGIPLGDFVGRNMGDKLMKLGYWRTPLQISSGVFLALSAPLSIFMSPKERRLRRPETKFQQRKAKRTWSTNMVIENNRVESDSRVHGKFSSKLSLDGSRTSLRTDSISTTKKKTSLLRDCNFVLSFVSALLPPMTWFIHWFGMEAVWQEIDHTKEVDNLLRKITIASEVACKLSIALITDRIDVASNVIFCFVTQFLLYIVVCFTELTLPSTMEMIPITTVVSGAVRGMFDVLAFSMVIRIMGSSHYRRKPVTVTMVAIGSGYLCGLLLSVGVHVTTNALRHVFFLNILAYQFALLVIIALPIQKRTKEVHRSHRGLSIRESISTEAVQLSVVIEENPPNNTSSIDVFNSPNLEVSNVRRKISTTW